MIELPTLYAKNAEGKLVQWTVSANGNQTMMEYGRVGCKLIKTYDRSTAINTGKANALTAEQHALVEARARWEKKKDEGYFESQREAKTSIVYLPMLAYPVIKRVRIKGREVIKRRPFDFPVDVQRKLNGLRCLASRMKLTSRQGTQWNVPHIAEHIKLFVPDGHMLDGELYRHGIPLQTLNSLVKDNCKESEVLEYHVYDYPINSGAETWEQRKQLLMEAYSAYESNCKDLKVLPVIKLVETFTCKTQEEIDVLNVQILQEGYEGLILRKLSGTYRWNDRSNELLKWKTFTDAEFTVIDMTSRIIEDGNKTVVICDVCICKNDTSDATFKVVPVGSNAKKAAYWASRESYIGERLIVRFLERSIDGIPQGNTVGIAFRLSEDRSNEDEDMWD
jgi:DNA ligase-1